MLVRNTFVGRLSVKVEGGLGSVLRPIAASRGLPGRGRLVATIGLSQLPPVC